MGITFITGGARSGKSSFAQKLATEKNKDRVAEIAEVAYLATSLIGDAEMLRRVKIHRDSRPTDWITVEEPYELSRALDNLPPTVDIVLVDCLTVWLSNLLFRYLEKKDSSWANKEEHWQEAEKPSPWDASIIKEEALEKHLFTQVKQFTETAEKFPGTLILVSNEVGSGIVPEHYLGRLFRDIAGKTNQIIAAKAEKVYLVVAGIPWKIKG
ncbi:MAG: bifunctional adenosylcobinamide kinase/adenosylcobinamide-phosphate guanylyltransferase [Firmicutes bacterium]|nr:bifunctional adenosylcobinamide kinase/adenosylcobinamide-phosphate guanylyltransferase [Bacillota bacterium]